MHSPWIFRGQSYFEWDLKTSLERFLQDEKGENVDRYNMRRYYYDLSSVIPAINSLTDKKFERFEPSDLNCRKNGTLPQYELLCFARHHGFPTPILDWTYSYYVAAFFAFVSAKKDQDVAIFSYKEWSGETRGGWVADPIWDTQGPYVETHPRHYKQQSAYTVCRAEIEERGKTEIFFMNHETAARNDPANHSVKKFVLKADEKQKVLEMLYSMNINAYTLFGNDESLMQMLAFKELILE